MLTEWMNTVQFERHKN